MKNLHLKIEDKVAVLEFDQPDSKVNVLNTETMQELSQVIDQLADGSSSGKTSGVKALVLTSKKDGIFIAGADIKEIESISSAAEALEKAEAGKRIFNKLEGLNLITVAAINGACVGGGLEMALACNYRVGSFSDKVKIGLPEVKLGVIPGFDGTQRLPKLIGLMKGMTMILSGQIVPGKKALQSGLVDRLFPENRLLEDALAFVNDLLSGKVKKKKQPKIRLIQKFLENTSLGRKIMFSQAKKNVLKLTKGFYPAPLEAIEVIKRSHGVDAKEGSRIEGEAFSKLAVTDVSKGLIKVFYLMEKFKKFPWVDAQVKPASVNKCGILGAGVMGGGIAQLVSFRDVPTRVKDINNDALLTALKTAFKLFSYTVKKRKLTKAQAEGKFALISPTVTYRGFENADLVIEAVVEDLGIKKKVFKEIGEVTGDSKAVIASNTSSLPIGKMSDEVLSPERVVGLHFFNPVHRMPLVEVIKAEKTSDETLSTVIAFARKLGKIVIVVKDVPGFLINRILLAYMNEAGLLLDEGMKIERIDKIVLEFGMPMGPLELTDEVGIDVGYKVAKILEEAYGARMRVASVLEKTKQKGLLGAKSKRGFFIHKGKKKTPNPEIYKLTESSAGGPPSEETALKRMLYIMINEAARCLEERVIDRPDTLDIGMIMGTGFPPFRAGLLRYADSVGISAIVEDLRRFEKEFKSERFKPCALLAEMAQEQKKFYR